MKRKKEMNKNFSITNHFISRFNQRYLKRNQQCVKEDLRNYLNAIMTSGQIRKMNKYIRNINTEPVKIGMGSEHSMIFANNKLITVIYK